MNIILIKGGSQVLRGTKLEITFVCNKMSRYCCIIHVK